MGSFLTGLRAMDRNLATARIERANHVTDGWYGVTNGRLRSEERVAVQSYLFLKK